jgi:hypothetical protein
MYCRSFCRRDDVTKQLSTWVTREREQTVMTGYGINKKRSMHTFHAEITTRQHDIHTVEHELYHKDYE